MKKIVWPKGLEAKHKNKRKQEYEVHKQKWEKDTDVLAYKIMLIHWAALFTSSLLTYAFSASSFVSCKRFWLCKRNGWKKVKSKGKTAIDGEGMDRNIRRAYTGR